MATYSITSTSSSVTYVIESDVSDVANQTYRVYLRLSTSGSLLVDTGYTLSSSSFPYTVGGLSPSTAYVCNVGVMKPDGTWYNIGSQTFTTSAAPGGTRPQYFNWKSSSSDGIQATKVASSLARETGNNDGDTLFIYGVTYTSNYTTYITAARWNGLLTNIGGVAAYKNKTVSLPASVASGSKILASSYNAVIAALRTLNSSFATATYVSSTTVTFETKILAGHFNLLQDWINSVT